MQEILLMKNKIFSNFNYKFVFNFVLLATLFFSLQGHAFGAVRCSTLLKEEVVPQNTRAKLNLRVDSSEDILKVGKKIKTPGGLKLTIDKVILDGHKGVVYRGVDKSGKPYAIKVPRYDLKDYNYDSLGSLQREIDKVPGYEKLKILYARIFEYGEDYIVKEWVEGVRGDEWVKKWVSLSKSNRKNDPLYRDLMDLFQSIASQRSYVGNLKSINLIHNGEGWIIVDGGGVKFNTDEPGNIISRYQETFENRWIRNGKKDDSN